MKPLIKYPGGKEKEIKIIRPRLPQNIANYYEPFFGGGAVYFALAPGNIKYINDISTDLTNFYECVQNQDGVFFAELNRWNSRWRAVSAEAAASFQHLRDLYDNNISPDLDDENLNKILIAKFRHIRKKADADGQLNDFDANIEAAFKQALFVEARNEYNSRREFDGIRAALFVLMRQYGFSAMFRYNSDGEFNIPYGGLAYNDKYLDDRIELMQSDGVKQLLGNTVIGNYDFLEFMGDYPPQQGDFIFVDPPYDTEFSTYDNSEFGRDDQHRLANYLIGECVGNWMLDIKATDFIRELYPEGTECANGDSIHIFEFDKRYDVCIRGRNEQNCEHLLITNYPAAEE